MGLKVSLSTSSCWRTGSQDHMLEEDDLPALKNVVRELRNLKKQTDMLTTIEYYLDRIPQSFEHSRCWYSCRGAAREALAH